MEIAEKVICSNLKKNCTNEHISEKTIAINKMQCHDLAKAALNSFVEET